jgi:hypothetical protein
VRPGRVVVSYWRRVTPNTKATFTLIEILNITHGSFRPLGYNAHLMLEDEKWCFRGLRNARNAGLIRKNTYRKKIVTH